jgi:hypothetical protein
MQTIFRSSVVARILVSAGSAACIAMTEPARRLLTVALDD